MSILRVIYEAEPSFPPTDYHPDAVRYQVGEYWIDAVGDSGALDDQALEDLGQVLYQERREAREKLAREVIDRVKKPL